MPVKPKHELLQDFTKLIFRHDPMKLAKFSDEYEPEALSILSRFCEGALHVADDEEAVVTYALEVVKQTFGFWFGEAANDTDLKQVSLELLKVYIESFPTDEKQT